MSEPNLLSATGVRIDSYLWCKMYFGHILLGWPPKPLILKSYDVRICVSFDDKLGIKNDYTLYLKGSIMNVLY